MSSAPSLTGVSQAVEEADVFAGEVHVDEPPQRAVVVGDPRAQLVVARRTARRGPPARSRPRAPPRTAPSAAERSWVGIFTTTAIRPRRARRTWPRRPRASASIVLRLEGAADRVERLQALAGDHQHDALVGVDVAARGELREHGGGDAAGGLGEDAGRLRQQRDALADLLVADGVDRAAASRARARARTGRRRGCRSPATWRSCPASPAGRPRGPRRRRCATGEQPSAWAPFIRGSSPSSSPSSRPLLEALRRFS